MKFQNPKSKIQTNSKFQTAIGGSKRWVHWRTWSWGFLWLWGFGFWSFSVRAEIPEPDNVFWGSIQLVNRAITASDTDIVIEARKTANGPAVAHYQMGAAPAYGNLYSLRVPVEAFLPLADTNASRVGGVIYLTVRDRAGVREQRTVSIPSRGRLTRVDFVEADSDGDGLPDRWESQYFGSPTAGDANADSDSDGYSNLQEFLAGANPLIADGRHPADIAAADNEITFEEMDDYINAWLNGTNWPAGPTNIPVSYVARAATLWLGGGTYAFTNTPPTNAPMWWVNVPPLDWPGGSNHVSSQLPPTHAEGQPLPVQIQVTPHENVLVYAVEDAVPAGSVVTRISDGGVFDPVRHKVKWGPFFEAAERELSYTVTPTFTNGVATFAGAASFDGVELAIGPRNVSRDNLSGGALQFIATQLETTNARFVLRGAPLTNYVIETSTNLVQWETWQTVSTDSAGRYELRPATMSAGSVSLRFYRARTP